MMGTTWAGWRGTLLTLAALVGLAGALGADETGKTDEACLELLRIEGEEEGQLEEIKPTVMRQLVLAIARQGNTERAIKITDDLIKADPRNWLHLALKAQVLRLAEKVEDAAKLYLD